MTLPCLPRSPPLACDAPVITSTVSPFLIFILATLTGLVLVDDLAEFAMAQSTSGASEMIFMKRFSRSSRPTGPKMRVPRGSPSGRSSTAAFSSKRM